MELSETGTNRRALLSKDGKEDSDRTGWNRMEQEIHMEPARR